MNTRNPSLFKCLIAIWRSRSFSLLGIRVGLFSAYGLLLYGFCWFLGRSFNLLLCLILFYFLILLTLLLTFTLGIFNYIIIIIHSHLVPNFLLNILQSLSIDELCKWVQFPLVEKCYKVITKSSHFGFSMIKGIFEYSSSCWIHTMFLFRHLSNSHLLSRSFSISSLSYTFLKKHNNKSSNKFILRIFRALIKENWNFIDLDHNIRKEEFKSVL